LPDTVLLVKNYTAPATNALPFRLLRAVHRRGAQRQRLTRAAQAAFDPFNPAPFPAGEATFQPNPCSPTSGGDALAVNGYPMPLSMTDPTIPKVFQAANQPTRYRVVNASSDSYLNVGMLANGQPKKGFKVLARDGVAVNWLDPYKPEYVLRDNVFLPPSGRVDLYVESSPLPQTIVALAGSGTFCTGYNGINIPARGIVSILPPAKKLTGMGLAAVNARALPKPVARTAADKFAAAPFSGTKRAVTFTEYGDGTFYVTLTGTSPQPLPSPFTEQPFWLSKNTSAAPGFYLPEIMVKKNPPGQDTIEEWYLFNATLQAHAFHIHQLTFVALESAFEPQKEQKVFLDSIALPAGAITGAIPLPPATPNPNGPLLRPSRTIIKINFTNVDKGTFVYHCHMLAHEDAGMMGIVTLY
ncbi:MAG TPA: multicopper oxidase domain-containing protein, partial [Xanthomonadales bacterium]|nr:multicopper oxidase domain-containing protein [Xanthomonadales bacterium]